MLHCLEQDTLTIWDIRSSVNNGNIKRIKLNGTSFSNITMLNNEKIAIAGNQKTLFILDARKWTNVINVKLGVKSQLLKILPSLINPKLIYAVGVDHDLTCSSFFERKRNLFFGKTLHVDASWASINIMTNQYGSEIVVGLTVKGTLFLVFKPYQLYTI